MLFRILICNKNCDLGLIKIDKQCSDYTRAVFISGLKFSKKSQQLRADSIQKMSGIVSIEGNLGAGKSTLLSFLNVQTIKEPVDQWSNVAGTNILERYYNDTKRWAFTFQLNALHSRSLLWKEITKKQPNVLHFSERSPMADRYIFGQIMGKEGNMQASEFLIYDQISKTLMASCPVKAIIYLKCDPAICYQRIKKRNRQGEQSIPLEYLKKVHDRHEQWISRQQDVKILTVDTGAYNVENPDQLAEILDIINQFITSLRK